MVDTNVWWNRLGAVSGLIAVVVLAAAFAVTGAFDGDIDPSDSAQTIANEPREIEIAAFAKVKQGMLVEWRMVLDLTIFNEFRRAVGLPLID